jgi:hypothetical protein
MSMQPEELGQALRGRGLVVSPASKNYGILVILAIWVNNLLESGT